MLVKLEKTIKYGIYLAMLLPLVFTSRTMFPWHFGKTVLFQILIEVLLVLALVYFSLNKEKRIIKLNLFDWLVFAFVVCQLVSAIFGINFTRSFWGDQRRAQGVFTWLHFTVFYFLLRQFFRNKKDWQNLIIWMLAIGFISSLIAWFGHYLPFLKSIVASGRLSGMLGNPIFFAGYLIILVFLAAAGYFFVNSENKQEKNSADKWKKIFCLFCAVFGLATLLFTQVRGAIVGLIAGIFAIWAFYLILSKRSNTEMPQRDIAKAIKKYVFIAGLSIMLLIASLYVYNQKSDYFRNNFPKFAHMLDIRAGETTANTRLMAWDIAVKGWQERPLLGWGPENYEDVFDKHYNPKFFQYSFSEIVWDKPHSYPLEVLCTMGLLGFACYAAIIAVLLVYLIKAAQRAESNRLPFIILIGAAAAYAIQNSFAFETSNSLLIWMSCIAFINYYCDYSGDEKADVYGNGALYKIIAWAAVLSIIIAPFLIYKNIIFFKASVYMGDVEDAAGIASRYIWQKEAPKVLQTNVPFLWEQAMFLTKNLSVFDKQQQLNKEMIETAAPAIINIFEQEINRNQQTYLFRFWLSQLYGFMGEYVDNKYYADSNKLLQEAWAISPDNQSIPLLLAKNYLLQNNENEAVEILSRLAEKNPDYEEVHWFFGLALVKAGREDEGVKELEKGGGFGLGYKNNILYLIDIYAKRKEYGKIISLYQRLIISEPNNPQYYASLAVAYAESGDEENTVLNLSKAVELQPELAAEAKKFLEQKGIDMEKYK